MMKINVFMLLLLFVGHEAENSEKIQLYLGGLFELSNHWWSKYVQFFPTVVEYALDIIHNNTDILSGYQLNFIVKDTQGKAGLAAKQMVELLEEDPPKVALLGPGLSDEITITGQIAPFLNILEMSYTASTSVTVDRDLFPTLFRTNQIQDDLNPVRIAILQYFGWTRVGTIVYQDDIFVSQMNLFHTSLKENGLTLITSALFKDKDTIVEQIRRLKQYDVRIFIGAFRSTIAPLVFCEVHKQGLYGGRYVWILDGPALYDNWIANTNEQEIPCSKDDLYEATKGQFTLNFIRLSVAETPTISGHTPKEFSAKMTDMISKTSYKYSRTIPWLFDSVWAVALGLNHSLQYLNKSGLVNYAQNPQYLEAIQRGLRDVDFIGVSGPVAFDDDGGRLGVIYIQQIFIDNTSRVGLFEQRQSNLSWTVPINTLWTETNGVPPKDVFTYKELLYPASMPALVLILILNTAGCLTAISLLAFNIIFRKNSNIKLSSPSINNVIICGSLLMYLAVFLYAADYSNFKAKQLTSSICMIRGWCMCIGFTTLFGALFAKTLRVHMIFRQEQLRKRAIQDVHLFAMLGVLLAIDCCILIPWSVIHRLVKVQSRESTKNTEDYDTVLTVIYTYCYQQYQAYWFAIIYVYKGLLLAFGTFLAWETRTIKVAALNDSKEIGFCVYTVVIVCLFGVPLAHVLPIQQLTLSFVMISGFIIFCTTLCLTILFVPKIRLRHQIRERTFVESIHLSTAGSRLQPSCSISPSKPEIDKNVLQDHTREELKLKEENEALRLKLAQEMSALAQLKRSLANATTGTMSIEKVGN